MYKMSLNYDKNPSILSLMEIRFISNHVYFPKGIQFK